MTTDDIKPATTSEEAFEALMHVMNEDDLTGTAHRIGLRVPDLFNPDKARENARVLATELRKVANRLIDSTRLPDQPRIRQLYSIHGEDANLWWCERCRIIRYSEKDAQTCCGPRFCDRCETQYEERSYCCMPCWHRDETEKAAARWVKAKAVSLEEYESDVFYVEDESGSAFGASREGWFYGIDELSHYLNDWRFDHPDNELPTLYVFGATPSKAVLDAESIVENATEEMHEDARSQISDSALEEMQEWLDAWVEKHSPTTYWPDYGVKITGWEAHVQLEEEDQQ